MSQRELTVGGVRAYVERKVAQFKAREGMWAELGDLLQDSPAWNAGKPLRECMSEQQFNDACARHGFDPFDERDPDIEREVQRLAEIGVEWAVQCRDILAAVSLGAAFGASLIMDVVRRPR